VILRESICLLLYVIDEWRSESMRYWKRENKYYNLFDSVSRV
jgi:hypothetical protein